MAKRSVTTKFRKMHKVNYRQEDEIVNSPHSCTSLECSTYQTSKDGEIDIKRRKLDTGIQYRHEKKEDVQGFIPKPIAWPKYRTVYQHQGMLLQNLHHRYLYIAIRLPHLKDLDRKISIFLNFDNYRICRAKVKVRLECKIIITLPALLPNKIKIILEGRQHLVMKMSKTTHVPEARELNHISNSTRNHSHRQYVN